jgi:hypothetical protein
LPAALPLCAVWPVQALPCSTKRPSNRYFHE